MKIYDAIALAAFCSMLVLLPTQADAKMVGMYFTLWTIFVSSFTLTSARLSRYMK